MNCQLISCTLIISQGIGLFKITHEGTHVTGYIYIALAMHTGAGEAILECPAKEKWHTWCATKFLFLMIFMVMTSPKSARKSILKLGRGSLASFSLNKTQRDRW
jgi:hypothetical protein